MFKFGTWSLDEVQGQEMEFSSVFQKDVSFYLGESPGFCFEAPILGKDFSSNF